MENYFENSFPDQKYQAQDLPVEVKPCEWEIKKGPERFSKTYIFDDRSRLKDFIVDLLQVEDQIGHHASHSIDHDRIRVEVNTKDIDRITNRDKEYCKIADKVYKNCLYYEYE